MRIATILQTFPSNHSYSYTRINALAEAGEEMRIYYRAKAPQVDGYRKLIERINGNGVTVSRLRSRSLLIPPSWPVIRYVRNATLSGLNAVDAFRLLRRASRIVRWRPDVIHIEENFNARQLIGILRHVGVPIVVSLRGDDICHKPSSDPELASWFRSMSAIDAVRFHCISEYVRGCAIRVGIAPERAVTIHQGVEQISLPDEGASGGRRDKVALIARLSFEKGVDVAVECMRFVSENGSDITLHIFGSGKMLEPLERAHGDAPYFRNIVFHGDMNNQCLREWLREHSMTTIGIQPSRREGLGQSILEMMASGIPVIASNVGGIPEIIEDGVSGRLIESDDPRALGKEILELLRDGELAGKLGSQAARRAHHFSDGIERERFLEYYRALVSNLARRSEARAGFV